MRLTLRTLLAYLDDTLEPSQAKIIGQKVAESEQAQELIAHIQQVTHRRRITTPPTSGPGSKLDPNTIAEYLDNAVSPEQAGEVEQICLASDVHLAEVAACHQILALVLGEPALVPPLAKQRMYGLVKGPEAIPFRKPSAPKKRSEGGGSENDEMDETLRMGLPSLGRGGKWSNLMVLLGGGTMAVILLGVALMQVLKLPGTKPDGPPMVAQNEVVEKKPVEPQPVPPVPPTKEEKGLNKGVEEKPVIKPAPKKEDKKEEPEPPLPPPPKFEDDPKPGKKEPEPSGKLDTSVLPEVRFSPPDNRPVSVGKYLMLPGKVPSVILTTPRDKMDWERLGAAKPDVQAGRTYVGLPGYRGTLDLKKGGRLSLWGIIPEVLTSPPVLESVIELHNPDTFDVDLTLQRGRIVLTNTRGDKPVLARIRFENPTQFKDLEFIDLALQGPGSELLIDRWSFFPPGEAFFKNPKDPNRLGPAAYLGFFVLKGKVQVRMGDVTYGLAEPPGRALLMWNSLKGLTSPQAVESVPAIVTADPPPPPGLDKKFRDDMFKARDQLAMALAEKAVDVSLTETLKAADPTSRIMAIRCYAALGDLANLVDALGDDRNPDIRRSAIRSLQNWMTSSRDNEYKVLDQLKTRYSTGETSIIMELFHGVQPSPDHLDLLVIYLNSPCLVVREMAYMNLIALVPAGRNIVYDANAEPTVREAAQKQWRDVLRKASASK